MSKLEDIVQASKKYGKKAGKAMARGVSDTAEFYWDNATPIWHKYSKPVLAGAIGYLGVSLIADEHVIPVVNSALDFISPVTDVTISPIVDAIDLRGKVQLLYGENQYGNAVVSFVDAGMGYVTNNFIPLAAKTLGAVAAWKGFNAFKETRAPSLPQGKGVVKKTNRTARKLAATAGTAVTLLTLYGTLRPELTELYKRFGGTNFEEDFGESFEKEEFTDAGLEELRNELLSLKSVDRNRMQKDAARLRNLGYTNITDKDLYVVSRVVAGEAGNYYQFSNHAMKQSNDMNGITNVIANRMLAAKAHSGFKNDWAEGSEVELRDIVLKRKQFSIANSRARRALWEFGYQSGSLTYGTGKARSKTLLAYANTVLSLAKIAQYPTNDPTRGALNYKNNAVGYAARKKWDGSMNRGFKVRYTHNIEAHSYYSYYDKEGDNFALVLRKQAEKTKKF